MQDGAVHASGPLTVVEQETWLVVSYLWKNVISNSVLFVCSSQTRSVSYRFVCHCSLLELQCWTVHSEGSACGMQSVLLVMFHNGHCPMKSNRLAALQPPTRSQKPV